MNGFNTLNRLLGKKNKSQTISKSTSNLSNSNSISARPLSHYDTSAAPLSSQLETANSIAPLSNVPFEQTFRITVHLPKGQLFVARLGAKTELEKLLLLVCEHKQLDASKYELRHPGNNSQVFGLDQTVGAVGLSEIRLCHKSESYDNFNAAEILTLRNTAGRNSLSSSELSSRNSKHTLKTASPYSSTNSLTSSDSAGMSNYSGQLGYAHPPPSLQSFTQQKPPVAPVRKKRAAPRPPSQNSVTLSNGNGDVQPQQQQDQQKSSTLEVKQPSLARKEFHVSTPNLTQCSEMSLLRTADFHKSNVSVDCNGNSRNSRDNNSVVNGSSDGNIRCNGSGDDRSPSTLNPSLSGSLRPASMSVLNNEILYQEKELNGNREFTVNGSISDLSPRNKLPEPAPRKRIITTKKKAPAPPPRNLQPVATPRFSGTSNNTPAVIIEVSQENSATASVPEEISQSTDRKPSEVKAAESTESNAEETTTLVSPASTNSQLPSSPSQSTTASLQYTTSPPQTPMTPPPLPQTAPPPISPLHPSTPPPQDDVKTIENTEIIANATAQVQKAEESNPKSVANKNKSIEELPIKLTNGDAQPQTPEFVTPPSTPATPTTHNQLEAKLSSGTSSDDDDQVKVYNIKLGKTIVQPIATYEANGDNAEKRITQQSITPPPRSPKPLKIQADSFSGPESTISPTSPQRAESPDWSYTIPAPPTFADNETVAATCGGSDRFSPLNGSELSDRDDSITATIDSHNETAITSDIEDGYRGGKKTQAAIDVSSSFSSSLTQEKTELPGVKEQPEVTISVYGRPKSVSPPRSPLESKAEVITQLNAVINNENSVDFGGIVKRSVDHADDVKIQSAKPSELSNFTIQSYNKPVSSELDKTIDAKTKTSEEFSAEVDDASKNDSNEHSSYIKSAKRPSLTLSNSVAGQLSRQRGALVTRSDSFHSTRAEIHIEPAQLSQSRSTSHVSLDTIQKQSNLNDRFTDTNRRKSSSELSIGETPSLQSLIVMKCILNSRKNSLTNGIAISGAELQSPEPLDPIPATPTTPAPAEIVETVNTVYSRPSLKDFVSVTEEKTAGVESLESKECRNMSLIENISKQSAPKDLFSIGRSQNASTPVNMSDCDSSKENSPKNKVISQLNRETKPLPPTREPAEKIYRYQGPPSINLSTWSERPKSQVAIKSDNDYKFGVGTADARLSFNSSESKSEAQNREVPKAPARIPFVRSVEYKKAQSVIDSSKPEPIERKSVDEGIAVPVHKNAARPLSVSNHLILGRMMPKVGNKNLMPVVKGFTSLDITQSDSTATETSKDHQNQDVVLRNPATIVRSNSAVSTSILRLSTGSSNLQKVAINIENKDPSPSPNQPATAPLFSQISLRKTGLKEKILASNDVVDSAPKPRSACSLPDQQQSCAKLEMKLTTTTTIPSNMSVNFTPTTPTFPNPSANGSAPNSLNRSSVTVLSEIPPPPPPIIRSVVTKQNSLGKSACIPDARDQLLSAIRNFNKDTLNRS